MDVDDKNNDENNDKNNDAIEECMISYDLYHHPYCRLNCKYL